VIVIADTTLEVDEQPTQALTFTATATDQDLPAQTLTFSLVAVDGQNYPTGAMIVTTDAGDGTASGAFSWSPTEDQGGMDYAVDVVVTDNGTPAALTATQRVTIAVAEVNVAPVLAGIPPQSAVFGQTLTFTASATDQDLPAQTLTYTMAGAPDGATLDSSSGAFAWTPTEAQAQNNYSFTVTVTDNGDPALFDEQVVTIGAITASHGAPGYRSPASLVVSNSIAFGAGLTSLAWSPELPAGWAVTAVDTLGNGEAAIEEDGTLTFTALPAVSPAVFTYTVSVPGDQAVSNLLCATVAFNGVTAQVEPLPLFRYHSADYRRDVSGDTAGQFRKIDSTEINRVLSYWRFGYKPDAAGYDGFSAAAGYAGTEAAHHSADTDKNWIVDGSELLRVQMYWRGGGYLVNLDTPDGYATDPYRTGSGPSLFALAGIPAAAQTAPSGYNPGETLQVTYTLDTAGASLLALGWAPELPAGWVIENVSGDAAPMFARNEIICGAAVLPTVTATITVTVRVPLTETRTVTLGGAARLITDSGYGVESYAMESVTLAPVDGDSNGMADAWERTFAGAAGSLDPAADLDGDTMSNLNEYRCGTLPNDAASVLKMVAVRPLADGKMQVSWASVAGRTYAVQRAVGSPAAANFMTILTGIAADPTGRNVYVDDADSAQARFYRVVLQD
ncbi:MAG TPA: putative Ig domain-containing protein, partial [Kiritimatiellia bacterium]|nr:putative Ig domain-containing protein [Kiritimatiellia bacterium]